MEQHETTGGIRINRDMVDKIRDIAKSKGQKISGYIEVNLSKAVERDWKKLHPEENEQS
jgi:hypothetical protein